MSGPAPGRAVVGALLVGALVLAYAAAVLTEPGQALDAGAFAGIRHWPVPLQDAAGLGRADLVVALALVVSLLGVLAVARRALREVATAVVVPLVAVPLALVLKEVLPRPLLGEYGYAWNTFPSGHTAVAAALLVAALGLVPPRLAGAYARALVGLVALAAGCSSYLTRAHRPSDVVGALLLVAVVALAVPGRRPARGWWLVAALGGLALALVAAAWWWPAAGPVVAWPVVSVLAASAALALAAGRRRGPAPRPAPRRRSPARS